MRLTAMLAALCLTAVLSAHADTLITYQATGDGIDRVPVQVGVFNDLPFTSTGSAIYDVDTDTFLSIDVTGSPSPQGASDLRFDGVGYGTLCFNDYYCFSVYGDMASGFRYTFHQYGSLMWQYPYPDDPTQFGAERELEEGGGILTEAATTPEPSSFALLGTGLLGVVGALKRRYA